MKQAVLSLTTIRDQIRYLVSAMQEHQVYFGHGTDNAWDDARWLVLGALHLPFDLDESWLNCTVTSEEKLRLAELFEQRVKHRVPVAYLLGEAWFAGLSFKVSTDTLIPRSPIAQLIADEYSPWLKSIPSAVLDLCTGSGCIGIATALAFPESVVTLADISPAALDVAEQNIHRFSLDDRVRIVESDLFSKLAGETFDLIVSNPPYVDQEDYGDMPAEFQHEPVLGLTSGDDGLDITRRILKQAALHLNDGGVLIVEVGNSAAALEEAFPQLAFTWIEFSEGGHGVFMLNKEDLLSI